MLTRGARVREARYRRLAQPGLGLHNLSMPNPPRLLSLEYLRRTPSAGLLLVQLAGILLYPWMETSPRGRGLLAAFGLVVLGVAVRVVRKSPWATWLAFVLAALEAAFYFYAAGSLIAYMMQDWVATTDELFAAGATFTLLVWAFAYTYLACEAVAPGSFSAPINPQGPRTWMELMFLSIAVLSGVGLSDILPLTPFARALVMLEAFSGVMYLAVVVSRLVALTMLAAKERK